MKARDIRQLPDSALAATATVAPPFKFTGTCAVCGELVADGRRAHRECEGDAVEREDRSDQR